MGRVAPERLNPVPLTVAPLIVTAVEPVAVRVMDCVAGVFRLRVPKAIVDALTVRVDVPEVPVTLMAAWPLTFV